MRYKAIILSLFVMTSFKDKVFSAVDQTQLVTSGVLSLAVRVSDKIEVSTVSIFQLISSGTLNLNGTIFTSTNIAISLDISLSTAAIWANLRNLLSTNAVNGIAVPLDVANSTNALRSNLNNIVSTNAVNGIAVPLDVANSTNALRSNLNNLLSTNAVNGIAVPLDVANSTNALRANLNNILSTNAVNGIANPTDVSNSTNALRANLNNILSTNAVSGIAVPVDVAASTNALRANINVIVSSNLAGGGNVYSGFSATSQSTGALFSNLQVVVSSNLQGGGNVYAGFDPTSQSTGALFSNLQNLVGTNTVITTVLNIGSATLSGSLTSTSSVIVGSITSNGSSSFNRLVTISSLSVTGTITSTSSLSVMNGTFSGNVTVNNQSLTAISIVSPLSNTHKIQFTQTSPSRNSDIKFDTNGTLLFDSDANSVGFQFLGGSVAINNSDNSSLLDISGGSITVRGSSAGINIAPGFSGSSSLQNTTISSLTVTGSITSTTPYIGDGSKLTGITSSGGGDNLGTHIATKTLDMSTFPIVNVGSMTVRGTITSTSPHIMQGGFVSNNMSTITAGLFITTSTIVPTSGIVLSTTGLSVRGGSITVDMSDSNTTERKIIGFLNSGSGNACTFTLGDDFNTLQNAFGNRVQLVSYHGIELIGGTGTSAKQGFTLGGATADPSVTVIATATTGIALNIGGATQVNGALAFSSVPVFNVGGSNVSASLAAGTTFFSFTVDSDIIMRRLTVVQAVAGAGGQSVTWHAKGNGNDLTVAQNANAGAGARATATGSLNVSGQARIDFWFSGSPTTLPIVNLVLEYTMR